jgi:hypothetical protein
MAKQESIDDIVKDSKGMVDRIRAYTRSQKAFWQRVPYLALQADGRDGFSDQYSYAYHYGYWQLSGSASGGYYNVYVDLATGELVNPVDRKKPAWDEDIAKLVPHLDELDAGKLVKELEDEAKRPYFSGYSAAEHDTWRDQTRRELKLKQVYTRKR